MPKCKLITYDNFGKIKLKAANNSFKSKPLKIEDQKFED